MSTGACRRATVSDLSPGAAGSCHRPDLEDQEVPAAPLQVGSPKQLDHTAPSEQNSQYPDSMDPSNFAPPETLMAPARTSPTVRRRLLSRELKRLRTEKGMTVAQASKEAGWNAAGLVRAENNQWQLPDVTKVGRLLDTYGVRGDRRGDLLTLARGARQRGWWFAYREISKEYADFIGYETGATMIRLYETLVVPGLLQTREYAAAFHHDRARSSPGVWSEEEIEALIEVRMQRQRELLADPDPVRLDAIVDEAALHRTVGGPQVMRAQLEHLRKMAELPHINLMVIPYSHGATLASGPFSIMRFPDGYGPEAGFLETAAGPIFMEDEATLNRLRATFEALIYSGHLSVSDSLRLIELALSELPH